MPKIIKTAKIKKPTVSKKSPASKVKATPIKKKVIKKAVVKKTVVKKSVVHKTKIAVPKKINRVAVDVISDEDITPVENNLPETNQSFSSWSDFGKTPNQKNEAVAEDIYDEADEESEEDVEPKLNTQEEIEEYDKQKKFFSDWATQNTPKEGEEKPNLAPKKSVGLYRRQAFFYIGATIVLLLAVCYLFFSTLTVVVLPQGEIINDSLTFDVTSADATSTATSTDLSTEPKAKNINGTVSIVDVTAEKIYQTTGEETLGGEEVTGTVNLINKYNKNQALVATTRLLSSDGKLFRLKEAVTIPAGGTINAAVYADKPSPEMTVASATTFTIPGLWAGMQTQIYAESVGDFTYQTKVKKYIKQVDLDQAKKDIVEVLDLKVKNDLKNNDNSQIVVYGDTSDNSVTTEFNAKLGDEKAEFIVKAKKQVAVVTFSKDMAAALAGARLSLVVPDDKQLFNFDKNKITYSLESFDETTKIAVIKAYFNASMSLRSDSSLIDRKKLVGLNRTQISEYLNGFPEIKSYELNFSPSFISTAPILPDKISIKIKDAQ